MIWDGSWSAVLTLSNWWKYRKKLTFNTKMGTKCRLCRLIFKRAFWGVLGKVSDNDSEVALQRIRWSFRKANHLRLTRSLKAVVTWHFQFEREQWRSSTAELRFNHCTAVTRSLGDPINNVDYTIKHTELREEVKAQRDKDTLLFTRDSLLESFLFVWFSLGQWHNTTCFPHTSLEKYVCRIYL